jgi:hypothetical protein
MTETDGDGDTDGDENPPADDDGDTDTDTDGDGNGDTDGDGDASTTHADGDTDTDGDGNGDADGDGDASTTHGVGDTDTDGVDGTGVGFDADLVVGTAFIRAASTPVVGGHAGGAPGSGSPTDSGSGSRVPCATGIGLGRWVGSGPSQCGETGLRAREKPTTAVYVTPARATMLAINQTHRRRRPVVSTKIDRGADSVGSSAARDVTGGSAMLALQLRPPATDRTSARPSATHGQQRRTGRPSAAGQPRPAQARQFRPGPGLSRPAAPRGPTGPPGRARGRSRRSESRRPDATGPLLSGGTSPHPAGTRDRVSPVVSGLAIRGDSEPQDGRAPRAGSDRTPGLTRQLPNTSSSVRSWRD